jgi:hypothetical protein
MQDAVVRREALIIILFHAWFSCTLTVLFDIPILGQRIVTVPLLFSQNQGAQFYTVKLQLKKSFLGTI